MTDQADEAPELHVAQVSRLSVAGVEAVAFGITHEGRLMLAFGGQEQSVRVWDAVTGQPVGEPLAGRADGVNSVAFGTTTGEGRLLLASGGQDRSVQVWDMATGQQVRTPLTGRTGAVRSVAFGVTGIGQLLLASGSDDGSVRVWDAVTGQPVGEPLTDHTDWVNSVAFGTTREGRLLLASGSDDRSVLVWDAVTGEPMENWFTGHTGGVLSVAFGTTREGRLLLASGSQDRSVLVWDAVTGQPVGQRFTGHTGWVNSVAFGTTGEGRLLLASGSDDRSVRVWDPVTGALVGKPLASHTSGVRSVAFGIAGQGQLLLAIPGDDSIEVMAISHSSSGQKNADRHDEQRAGDSRTGVTSQIPSANEIEIWADEAWSAPADILQAEEMIQRSQQLLDERRQALGADHPDTLRTRGNLANWLGRAGHIAEAIMELQLLLTDRVQWLGADHPDTLRTQSNLAFWLGRAGDVDEAIARFHQVLTDRERILGSNHPDTLRTRSNLGTWIERHGTGRVSPSDGSLTFPPPVSWDQAETQATTPGDDSTEQPESDGAAAESLSSGAADDPDPSAAADPVAPEPSDRPPDPQQAELAEAEPPRLARQAIVSSDDELIEDLLGREILAGHLAGVLGQLAGHRGGRDRTKGTVVVNVDGRWGSGKTVLAQLTQKRLNDPKKSVPTLREPLMIWFNAWQQAAIGPRWWTLSAQIKRSVEQERAGAARLTMRILSVSDRLLRSKALLLGALAVVGVAGLSILAPSIAGDWEVVSKVIAGIAAVATVTVGLGRVLFWSSPTIGKLYLNADSAPLAEVSDIVARLRRWSPRHGQRHRLADTALAIWLLLIFGWLMHQAIGDTQALDHWLLLPGPLGWLPKWSYMWVPLGIGVLVAFTIYGGLPIVGPTDGTDPGLVDAEVSVNEVRSLRRTTWSIALAVISGAVALWIVYNLRSAAEWTVPIATLLVFAGIGLHLWLLRRGHHASRRPIVLVIDDLDRCSADDTVEYLETIHTLMRSGRAPLFFPRWRTPAPFLVLALADGRWVRTAFERRYADFSALGDPTRQLGADFLQKLFDHTVLVPELTADQIKEFVEHVTSSPTGSHRGCLDSAPAPTPYRSDTEQLQSGPQNFDVATAAPPPITPPVPLDGDRAETQGRSDTPAAQTSVEPAPDLSAVAGTAATVRASQADQAQELASEAATDERTAHLLTSYARILPANPRLIRRVANTWGMLAALGEHVGHSEAEDTVVRAAAFAVLFPTLMDELLGSAPPIAANKITGLGYSGPWSHPDVLNLLRKDDGALVEPAELARCYGRRILPSR